MSEFIAFMGDFLGITSVVGLASIAVGCKLARHIRMKQRKQKQDGVLYFPSPFFSSHIRSSASPTNAPFIQIVGAPGRPAHGSSPRRRRHSLK